MGTETLLAVLAFGTLAAVAIAAYISSERTSERLHANSRKSTLAADAPDTAPPGQKPPDV